MGGAFSKLRGGPHSQALKISGIEEISTAYFIDPVDMFYDIQN